MFYGYKLSEKTFLRVDANIPSKDGEPLFIFKRVRKFKNASIWTKKKEALTWKRKVLSIFPKATLYSTNC